MSEVRDPSPAERNRAVMMKKTRAVMKMRALTSGSKMQSLSLSLNVKLPGLIAEQQ